MAEIIAIIQDPILFIKPIMMNPWLVYPVLWAIVGLESAFILCAWMPAETTMFLAGSLAAHHEIPIALWLLWLGYLPLVYIGGQYKYRRGRRHISQSGRLDDTIALFNKHAKLALLFGRYIPVVGIFMPVIAGQSDFKPTEFKRYNVVGSILWVFGSTLIGYYLGTIPFFYEHFTLLLVLIIVVPGGLYYLGNYIYNLLRYWQRSR